MIKQISLLTIIAVAAAGAAYLICDYIDGEDETKEPKDDNQEAEEPKDDSQEAEATEEDPRKELRSVLRSIEVTMNTTKFVADSFVETLSSDTMDTEKGKVVAFLMRTAVTTADEKVKEFLAGSYEYPFDELSDEEVLDVLAQAREQAVLVDDVLKEVQNVIAVTDPSQVA